ncbi:MAG: lytic murein transglycosylase [Pseudomonadota bacterium]
MESAPRQRPALWGLFWLVALAVFLWPRPALAADPALTPLQGFLKGQGLSPRQADALLNKPGLVFEAKLMANMFSRHERTLDYGQFLQPATVARARQFKKAQARELAQASARTHVPAELVVAILTVESGLGSYTGKYSTFAMLASQAVLDQPLARARLAQAWPKSQRAYLASAECEARFRKRAAWAREEIKGLLQLSARQGRSPHFYKGSPFGAVGMPQFVPTSVLKWGTDGNRDGRVDLNSVADAIHSVAVYLREHGWRPGLSRQEQYEVVHTYNHSQTYVNTVLALADRLR